MEEAKYKENKNLSRVKEILFGDDLQGLASRLKEITSEFSQQVKKQSEVFDKKMEDLTKENNLSITKLSIFIKEQKRETVVLAEQIDTKIKEIENKIAATQSDFEKKLEIFSHQSQKNTEDLVKQVKEEIEKSIAELRNNKVDKSEMAELFGMLINKLK